jgi:hypothetical protein
MNIVWDSPHDDEALMRTSAALLNGQWLGSWEQESYMLLAKAPGFPMFSALTHWTGLPTAFISYLLYMAGAALVARSVAAYI